MPLRPRSVIRFGAFRTDDVSLWVDSHRDTFSWNLVRMGRLELPSQASEACALSVELHARKPVVNPPGFEPGIML